MSKKVLIINSSPRANGNTAALVDEFMKGLGDAGHEAVRMDLRKMKINPCLACEGCHTGKGHPCVQKDDMQQIYDAWDDADVIVFASPVYWMQMNAPMMLVRDRLYAKPAAQEQKKKEAVLILTSATPAEELYHMPEEYYEYLLGVFGYTDRGRVIGGGVYNTPIRESKYMQEAYEIGRNL